MAGYARNELSHVHELKIKQESSENQKVNCVVKCESGKASTATGYEISTDLLIDLD